MPELTTDVAIIGAGSAGLNARREVERAGKRWLLIESGPYGTTCARAGCMPSKLLIAAAEAARGARHAPAFGVNIAPDAIDIDGQAVLARVRRERDRFAGLVVEDVERLPAAQRLHGRARFLGPNELQVGSDTRVKAKAIVIATGSRPRMPQELAAISGSVLTSDNVFELPSLPRSLAVFGTGAIGLELGQALQALGVRVTFYNPKQSLGPFTDPVIDRHFRAYLTGAYDLQLEFKELKVADAGDAVVIKHHGPDGAHHEHRFERVLAAAGRTPNLSELGLERAGIALGDDGVPEFDPETMQCGDAPIFIAGDADAQLPVLHEAVDDGASAGANAANFPDVQRLLRRAPLTIAFTHPQLAMLGLTYKQASQQRSVIGESSYERQGRARVIDQPHGWVRVYVEASGKQLLGAEMFGPGVEHTAHLLAWAVQAKLPMLEILRMPVYHPTLEEGIRSALRDAGKKVDAVKRDCPPADRGMGPGLL
jgi:dihydrolipoamide dehydrogenase